MIRLDTNLLAMLTLSTNRLTAGAELPQPSEPTTSLIVTLFIWQDYEI